MKRPDFVNEFTSPLFNEEHRKLSGEWNPAARTLWETITENLSRGGFPVVCAANVPLLRQLSVRDPDQRSKEDRASLTACTTEVHQFDGRDYGSPENPAIEVRAHVPHALLEIRPPAAKAIVYLHGGAFMLFSAADWDIETCGMAVDCEAVVFNVGYRNAPEARAPQGILDCYAAFQYVRQVLAPQYDIDPAHISLYGESSGGYLAVGVAMQLAKRSQSDSVRLVIADIPALSDQWIKPPEPGKWHWSSSEVEAWHGTHGHVETLSMLATDWRRQSAASDPDIFPGAMSEELLDALPEHVILTNEFDFLRTDAERFAARLHEHHKLRDFHIREGISHYGPSDNAALSTVLRAYG